MKGLSISNARFLVSVILLFSTTLTFGAAGPKKAVPIEPTFAPGEVLVKFKSVQLPPNLAEVGSRDLELGLLNALPNEGFNVLQDIRGGALRVNPITGVVLVKLRANFTVKQAIDTLQASGAVEYAEPNYRIHVGAFNEPELSPMLSTFSLHPMATPTDPSFSLQWGLNNTGQTVGGVTGTKGADIKAVTAWNTRTDASTTILAIMGTGIDYTHNDLKANMWKNPGETCGDGKDNDSDGYIDDCYGINAYLNTGDPKDDNGLGTHMAGIAGATGGNGTGVTGVAWKAKLMALKFLDEEGWGWSADAVQCIDYALSMRKKYSYRMVILAPVMGANYSKALYDSISTAQTNGVLFVTGAGDGNQDVDQWPFYPAAYDLPNIVSVASSESSDYTMGMSVGSNSVDLAAPGQNIYSTWLTNTYKLQTGSNSAASFAAGAAALVWAQNPTFNWKQIKALLLNGAEDGLHGNYWYGKTVTEGRLNLANSLASTLTKVPAIFSVTPQVTYVKEVITINGVNFGTKAGTVILNGGTYVYPSSAVSSWADEKIVLKLPADSPSGQLRIMVKNGSGTSRGALVRFRSPSSDQWIYPTWMGATLMQHQEAAFAQVGTDVWIISGYSNYEQTASVERFSLLSMSGQVNPDWEIPLAVRRAGAAAIGTKIYVAGGYDDATQKWQSALQIFDTTTGTWTRGHNLPAPLDEPSVLSLGGKLYVMGGHSPNNTGLKTTYVYNPASNAWTTLASLPLKTAFAVPVAPPSSVAGNNKIWLLSGYTESGGTFSLSQNVLEYDVSANSWTIRDDIPLVGQHGAGGGIAIGNKVLCMYGSGDYDAAEWISSYSGSWVRNIDYQSYQGSYTPMLAKVGNYVYVISGSRARNVYRISVP